MKTPAGENPGSGGILCRSVSLGEQPLCVFRKTWGMSAFHPFCFSGKGYKVVQVTKKLLGW